jgi:2-isopropylmalate synthase
VKHVPGTRHPHPQRHECRRQYALGRARWRAPDQGALNGLGEPAVTPTSPLIPTLVLAGVRERFETRVTPERLKAHPCEPSARRAAPVHPRARRPYVGEAAFAAAGIHASAIPRRQPTSVVRSVGNRRRVLVPTSPASRTRSTSWSDWASPSARTTAARRAAGTVKAREGVGYAHRADASSSCWRGACWAGAGVLPGRQLPRHGRERHNALGALVTVSEVMAVCQRRRRAAVVGGRGERPVNALDQALRRTRPTRSTST